MIIKIGFNTDEAAYLEMSTYLQKSYVVSIYKQQLRPFRKNWWSNSPDRMTGIWGIY
jgi:hypothetical protein